MAVSKRLRYEVLRRDAHTCRYCGRSAPEVRLTVDHVIPVALGGTDASSNLVCACVDCNSGKAATNPDAALVGQVADDALRWSAAMARAAEDMLDRRSGRESLREEFLTAWDAYDQPLPSGWGPSVDRFIAAGLPMAILVDCVQIAMGTRRVVAADKFRYMCGIAWSKVAELQRHASQQVGSVGEGADEEGDPRERAGRVDFACSVILGELPMEEIHEWIDLARNDLTDPEFDDPTEGQVQEWAAGMAWRITLARLAMVTHALRDLVATFPHSDVVDASRQAEEFLRAVDDGTPDQLSLLCRTAHRLSGGL